MSDNLTIVIMGPSGAGKGTQSDFLRAEGFSYISTGDLVRAEIERATPLGLSIKALLAHGKLVPDAEINPIFETAFASLPPRQDILLDGFPRNKPQVEVLDNLLYKHSRRVDSVLELVVPEDVARYRLLEAPDRRKRKDDEPTAVTQRHRDFSEEISRALEYYYLRRGIVKKIDGTRSVEQVRSEIATAVASLRRNRN